MLREPPRKISESSEKAWPFAKKYVSDSGILARGGTAPAPPECEDAFLLQRGPSSSYKYSVQTMSGGNGPDPPLNHVSIRPAGYSSKPQSRPGMSYMKATESSAHKTAAVKALPFGDLTLKRGEQEKKQFYPELADIKRPIASRMKLEEVTRERPPCRGEDPATNGVRPPSRQTNPHPCVGLDLPPRPITPPEAKGTEDPFDKTWSFSLRGQAELKSRANKGSTLTPSENKRSRWGDAPEKKEEETKLKFAVKAWEDDSKSKKPRAVTAIDKFPQPDFALPDARKPAASRPASGAVRGSEIPLIVTRSIERKDAELLPKRRIQSAALYVPRSQGAGPQGQAKEKFPFKTSLGLDFLGLFE